MNPCRLSQALEIRNAPGPAPFHQDQDDVPETVGGTPGCGCHDYQVKQSEYHHASPPEAARCSSLLEAQAKPFGVEEPCQNDRGASQKDWKERNLLYIHEDNRLSLHYNRDS